MPANFSSFTFLKSKLTTLLSNFSKLTTEEYSFDERLNKKLNLLFRISLLRLDVNSGYWRNPKSGNKGVVKIKGYFGSPECRLIENIYVVDDQASNTFGAACREKSGQWAMMK